MLGLSCCACAVLNCSVMSDSVTPWTVARQAPLSMGTLQARILEWVAIPFSNCSDRLWGILFVETVVQDNALLLVNKKGNKIKLLKRHFCSKNTVSKSNY